MDDLNIFYVYIFRRPDDHDPFYKWKSKPFYVGKGCNGRINEHRWEFNAYKNGKKVQNIHKNRVINKLRRNGLDYEEEFYAENLTEEEAFELEIKLIAFYGRENNGTGILTNLTDGGEGISGFNHSEESKQNISIKNKGKKRTKEARERMSKSKTGVHRSEETKQKLSVVTSGENNPFFGKHHTKEAKEKIGESQIGKSRATEKSRQQARERWLGENNPNFGLKLSDERKKKMKETREKNKKEKAFEICGHYDWVKCRYCKKYDDPKNNMYIGIRSNGRIVIYHRNCFNEDRRNKKIKIKQPRSTQGIAIVDIIGTLAKKFNMSRMEFFFELIPVKDSAKLLILFEEGVINKYQLREVLSYMINERINIMLRIILRDKLY